MLGLQALLQLHAALPKGGLMQDILSTCIASSTPDKLAKGMQHKTQQNFDAEQRHGALLINFMPSEACSKACVSMYRVVDPFCLTALKADTCCD